MKLLNKILVGSLSISLILSGYVAFSQSVPKGNLSISINYFIANNKIPSLTVKAKTKVNGRFQNVPGIAVKLFLDKDSTGTFIGEVTTNEKGEASVYISPALQTEWKATLKHTFLATFAGNKKYEPVTADLTVVQAKILIDASDKTVTATVFEMKDNAWVPVKGVDVVLAIRRLASDLPINETPTFATDSTGKASGDFKRANIPGDTKGNITLVAKIVDNDQYGNASIEKAVPWGAKFIPVNTFNNRTLFATRGKAPIWLILISTSIVIAVWGILIMLVFNLFKIKNLGKAAAVNDTL